MELKVSEDRDKSKFLPSISLDKNSIPSKGLSYPKDFSIKYYPYTFGEVKRISQSKLSFKDKYSFVLEGIETSFNKLDLTTSDFIYIGILRNLSTFDTKEIKVNYHCRHCLSYQTQQTNLREIEFDDLKLDLPIPYKIDFSFGNLEFKPLTLRMLFELYGNNLQDNSTAIAAMESLKSTDTKAMEIEFTETYNKLIYSNLSDGEKLNQLAKDFYHGLSKKEFICNACKESNQISIDGGDGDVFISPFRTSIGFDTN